MYASAADNFAYPRPINHLRTARGDVSLSYKQGKMAASASELNNLDVKDVKVVLDRIETEVTETEPEETKENGESHDSSNSSTRSSSPASDDNTDQPLTGNETTEQCTRYSVRLFKGWCAQQGETRSLDQIPAAELDRTLARFYMEVRNKDGELHTENTLITVRYGINRYLQTVTSESGGSPLDIIDNAAFAVSNRVFQNVVQKLKEQRTVQASAPQTPPVVIKTEKIEHAEVDRLGKEDLIKLYQSGVFSPDSPKNLLYKVWFELVVHFCKKGREQYKEITRDTFAVATDDENRRYVYCAKPLVVTNLANNCTVTETIPDTVRMVEQKGHPLCPVVSFCKYISKLSTQCPYLFQRHKDQYHSWEPMWYLGSPMGKNSLGTIMQLICQEAHLGKLYTNDAVRTLSPKALEEYVFSPNSPITLSLAKAAAAAKSEDKKPVITPPSPSPPVANSQEKSQNARPEASPNTRPEASPNSRSESPQAQNGRPGVSSPLTQTGQLSATQSQSIRPPVATTSMTPSVRPPASQGNRPFPVSVYASQSSPASVARIRAKTSDSVTIDLTQGPDPPVNPRVAPRQVTPPRQMTQNPMMRQITPERRQLMNSLNSVTPPRQVVPTGMMRAVTPERRMQMNSAPNSMMRMRSVTPERRPPISSPSGMRQQSPLNSQRPPTTAGGGDKISLPIAKQRVVTMFQQLDFNDLSQLVKWLRRIEVMKDINGKVICKDPSDQTNSASSAATNSSPGGPLSSQQLQQIQYRAALQQGSPRAPRMRSPGMGQLQNMNVRMPSGVRMPPTTMRMRTNVNVQGAPRNPGPTSQSLRIAGPVSQSVRNQGPMGQRNPGMISQRNVVPTAMRQRAPLSQTIDLTAEPSDPVDSAKKDLFPQSREMAKPPPLQQMRNGQPNSMGPTPAKQIRISNVIGGATDFYPDGTSKKPS